MNRDKPANSEEWEKDPVWDLLRQSPPATPRPSFSADVVRAARLESNTESWWKRFWVPLTVGSLTTAATAALAAFLILQQPQEPITPIATTIAPAESLESLEDLVCTEALLVAAENPAEFSDAELVSLISF